MTFTENKLIGSYIIEPSPLVDDRGWFARTFCKMEFSDINHTKEWVQHNHSFTSKKGTIRGLHYQIPPFSEIKLVRCISGVVYDIIVDLRFDSPTFLNWFGTELSAVNRNMIYIPEGFAHGFQTMTDNCELIYLHSEYYKPNSESGLLYNDPKINIDWPFPVTEISERDRNHPLLDDNFNGLKISE
jgi:dTDP-4-dehydrorhamnose 3,5-epimerase